MLFMVVLFLLMLGMGMGLLILLLLGLLLLIVHDLHTGTLFCGGIFLRKLLVLVDNVLVRREQVVQTPNVHRAAVCPVRRRLPVGDGFVVHLRAGQHEPCPRLCVARRLVEVGGLDHELRRGLLIL